MGGCASKPKALLDDLPEPIPREAPDSPKKATVPEENNYRGEVTKEEPLVDHSEPAQEAPNSEGTPSQEAPNSEGTSSESKTVEAEAVSRESIPSESSEVTAKPTNDKVEAAKATEPAEEKKVEDVAEKPKVDVVALSSEDKSDAPLVTV
ncbi:uncharacterized protein LOC132312830 [Cornus florida]|uniref:uncharacterized protein LOC132312830 n=1 Tax=Cornus florida TaxID=4283 RepID=UPI0028A08B26|nr:uncharacterized protein LOC132312830 [Cornus florida]